MLSSTLIDELGYVALAEVGAELLFQLIAERAEKAAVIATTNLPFSEWTSVFPNARLCKALLDRLTDRAHIIDTGTESYRFRRTLAQRQKNGSPRSLPSPPEDRPGGTGAPTDRPDPEESQRPLMAPPGRAIGSTEADLSTEGNRRRRTMT